MTYDLHFYINTNLDLIHEWFEMVDSHKIQIQGVGTIALETLLDSKSAYIYFYNIHCFPKLDFNLLSLRILEKKVFYFVKKHRFLYVINNERDKILQTKQKSIVYLFI